VTVEVAILSALNFEVRVRDHYARAADATSDSGGRGVFGALSQEEQRHVDYLESRLSNWRKSGQLNAGSLATTLPNPAWLKSGRAKMHQIALDHDYSSEIAMLKDALKLEMEVSDHYRMLVSELDGEGQVMFRRFMVIEEAHTAIVQAEIDALQGDGFWFDLREFDLETG
jgi:rubrerythrin